jgi:putative endonuclease
VNGRISLGKSGEELAAGLLRKNGYRIIARNYKTKLGEIDIIAWDKDTLCFIEVKTRTSDRFGSPKEAVAKAKQGQIAKSALAFLQSRKMMDKKARFDVVAITGAKDKPEIELIRDAFALDEGFTY